MHKTQEMLDATHKRFSPPVVMHLCFDHGVTYDPEWMCPECERTICYPHDELMSIIEAAYHCAFSNDEIHEMIKNAGLPESSDETIAFLIGEYGDRL